MITLSQYFDLGPVSLAAGVLVAGIPTVATTWRNGRRTGMTPVEPGFSAGLVLVYLPVAYALGGLASVLVEESDPRANAMMLLVGPLAAHAVYLVTRRSAGKSGARPVGGITGYYPPAEASRLREALQHDLARVGRVRVIAPNLMALLTGSSPLGQALREAAQRGVKIECLNDGDIGESREHRVPGFAEAVEVVGVDRVDASNSWVILSLGRVEYFGVLGDKPDFSSLILCRSVLAGDGEALQIGDSIHALVDKLFSAAVRGMTFSRVVTCSSPKDYRMGIIPAEAGASRIDRLPKRISVVFKGEETVRTIAEQRFGRGSVSARYYIEEHEARRAEFFSALSRGMQCREIYNADELEAYLSSRRHAVSVRIRTEEMRDSLLRWRQAIEMQPNYLVGISEDPLPFKYELIDGRLVVLHEAVGVGDQHRMNALFIHGRSVGDAVQHDFDTVWERIPSWRRSQYGVLNFIDDRLLPILQPSPEDSDVP